MEAKISLDILNEILDTVEYAYTIKEVERKPYFYFLYDSNPERFPEFLIRSISIPSNLESKKVQLMNLAFSECIVDISKENSERVRKVKTRIKHFSRGLKSISNTKNPFKCLTIKQGNYHLQKLDTEPYLSTNAWSVSHRDFDFMLSEGCGFEDCRISILSDNDSFKIGKNKFFSPAAANLYKKELEKGYNVIKEFIPKEHLRD